MKIRERLGQLPAWKALLLLIFALSMLTLFAEEIFFAPVFYVINHTINRFQVMFKEDDQDIDRDYENFNEQEAFDIAKSSIGGDELAEPVSETNQQFYCYRLKRVHKMEALLSLPWAKNHDYVRDSVKGEIALYQEQINDGIKKDGFQPSQCKSST